MYLCCLLVLFFFSPSVKQTPRLASSVSEPMCPVGLTHISRCSHFVFLFLFLWASSRGVDRKVTNRDMVSLGTAETHFCSMKVVLETLWDKVGLFNIFYLRSSSRCPFGFNFLYLWSETPVWKLTGEETETQYCVWKIEPATKQLLLWVKFHLNTDGLKAPR